jgi:hypothetical protein
MRILLISLVAASALPAQELTQQSYVKWRDYILPASRELDWLNIPWRNNLWEAAIEANQKQKPILLWTMNGHPLGCT